MLNGITPHRFKIPPTLFYYLLSGTGLLLLTALVFSPYVPYSVKIKPGDIVKKNIVSPRYLEFESTKDQIRTKELRENRARIVEKVFSIQEDITKSSKADLVNLFTILKENRKTGLPTTQTLQSFSFLTRSELRLLLKLDPKNIAALEYVCFQTIDRLLQNGLHEVNPADIQNKIDPSIHSMGFNRQLRSIILKMLLECLKPNLLYDPVKTRQAIQKEEEIIRPFTTKIKEGEPIVYKDERLTPEHIEILKVLKIYGAHANIFKFFGIYLMGVLLFLLIERFIYYFNRRIHSKLKYLVLIYCTILLVCTIARLLLQADSLPVIDSLKFLIPIPIASMILSILVTHNISMLCGTIISIFVSIMYGSDFMLFFYLFLSNCVAAFSTYKRYSRIELMQSGYIVGAFNVVVVLCIGLFQEVSSPLWFAYTMLIALINGILSSMISLAVLPYFENIFQITTSQSLLENSNLNHPLLKRLMTHAPGTYQHSLMVANLAEAAAQAIYADYVLTKIGAYFHDIGKLKRPGFFTENQFSGENPHHGLTPRMSKMIIASHTKDGIELATKYKLPDKLKDFILEHHGTSLVSFFYTQALQMDNGEDPELAKEEFRYPGPKPQSKETGIVMLADSVEAAVRSLEKPSQSKIENLVEKIFNDRIDDTQLSDCPLSLKEIETIKEAFLTILKGIYHSRLNYETEVSNIIEQAKNRHKGPS